MIKRALARCGLAVLVAVLIAVRSAPALAHASDRGFVMLLPTQYYLAGGAVAVAVSFLLLAVVPASWLARLDRPGTFLFALPARGRAWISGGSFVILLGLLYAGLAGSRDPLSNPLPLTIWTLWWVGLTLLHAIFGNLWSWLNPWTGPRRLLELLLGQKRDTDEPLMDYPAWLGYGPAILGFLAFAWFELIDPAPDDPARLAWAVLAYWGINFGAILVFGETQWLARGECFAVFFRFISRLAHLRVEEPSAGAKSPVRLCWPGSTLVREPPLPISGVLFLLLTLGSVSFDGLNKTFLWLGLIGQNPLEFSGRSAVMAENSAGLVLVWAAMSLGYGLAIWLGWIMAGRGGSLTDSLGRLVLSIMPISLAFHLAHYFTVLLVNGQYALLALNDPLDRGLNLLGMDGYRVTTSFLSYHRSVEMIWNLQAAAIVVGHVLAVLIAHRLALRIHDNNRTASLSQIPLAALMVAYTVFGLWLLSTPTGA